MSHRVRMLTSAEVVAPADITGIRLPVEFDYDPADPLAITLIFSSSRESCAWVISRDLLRGGVAGFSGPGEISAWSGTQNARRYYLRIQNESWTTVFCFRGTAIAALLKQVYSSVPAGSEFHGADLDAELIDILREAA